MMLQPDPDDLLGKAYDPRIARRLLAFVLPYRGQAVAGAGLILVATAADLLLPTLFSRAIDEVNQARRIPVLNLLGIAFIVTLVVRFFATWGEFYMISWLGNRVVFDLRNKMFRHLQTLSVSYIDRRGVGSIMSRIQNDVGGINEFFDNGVAGVISSGAVLLGIIIIMLITNWRLALLSFLVLPIMILFMRYWREHAIATYRDTRRTIAIVNANLAESIAGVRVSHAFTREPANIAHFRALNQNSLDTNIRAARLSAFLFPVVSIIGAVATAMIIVIGGRLVFDESLTVGELVLFVALIDRFFEPIRDLSQQYNLLQSAMASGERIFEVLDVEPEVQDKPGAIALPPITGRVDYNNVSFGYGETQVLFDIELHAQPGQTIALVGETGAGKSSIINLLLRFADVWSGSITIDGHDVRDVTQRSLRSQLGIVLQDTFLFGGSVRDNIAFARPNATLEDIVQAAKDVGAHEFIRELSDGYDTEIQERGVLLSVGQRQLLSFARALLADPQILILDEATSYVDTQTEQVIQQALRRLLHGRTSFVIAHRLSTIRQADKVVVLEHGRIVEQGNHDELMALEGAYYGLYSMQWRDSSSAAD
ncbi:MAG: ABC transporter ATP-binding protein/permease [Chloroflexota bacterium]|nr:ABC transporter ATP-binding protein/permease [Chloroflexota bacterium]